MGLAPTGKRRLFTAHADGGLCERLLEAGKLSRRPFPEPACVEEQLYEALSPLRADKGLCTAFHIVEPARKLALIELMRDARARRLGLRIIYNEERGALSSEQRAAMDQKRLARMHARDDVPWMTVGKALAEIDSLLPTAVPPGLPQASARALAESAWPLTQPARHRNSQSSAWRS